MRTIILAITLILLPSCGLLTGPMILRLSPEDQAQVDTSWKNILAHETLTHQELLDVIMINNFINGGLDSVHYHAEKNVGERLVVMEVIFDQHRPQRDSFTVEICDKDGNVLRRERYNRDEVEQTNEDFRDLGKIASTEPSTQPATPDKIARQKKLEARAAMVTAATQPVTR